MICNRAEPDRSGELLCRPWEFLNILGKLLELITSLFSLKVVRMVTQLFFIMACHLTKMDHCIPCHKEITVEESSDLFINFFYRLHGAPNVIVSDRDPKFV